MTPETPNQIVDSDFRTDEYSNAKKDHWMTTRRRILVGFGLVLPAMVFLVTSGEQSGGVTTNPVTLNFGEVVTTDLVEETEYEGTLGRTPGDPVRSPTQGTVTALASVGSVVEQGGELFRIDDQPTVLLLGEIPLYRDLMRSDSDLTIAPKQSGTITWLPEPGTVIIEGDILFKVNGEPVIALYGLIPAFRAMADQSTDIEGDDVLQLEESLNSLGFVENGEMTVDGVFTSATESVVEKFQEAVGAAQDGVIALGDIVVIPGPTEVSTILASVGDAAASGTTVLTLVGDDPMTGSDVLQLEQALADLGFAGDAMVVDGVFSAATRTAIVAFEESVGLDGDGTISRGEVMFLASPVRVSDLLAPIGTTVSTGTPVLAITGKTTLVAVDLPAQDQGTLQESMAVRVRLPDGVEVAATVTSVATVTTVADNSPATLAIEIVLTDPTATNWLDGALVDVLVVTDSAQDVLAVPVAALVALVEGGYAVEVDTGGGSIQLVAVDPGFYADGLVEVSGTTLRAGDQVLVP